jgi:guanylate kinase
MLNHLISSHPNTNPEIDKRIDHINSIAKFPLILVMGGAGNGKDAVVNHLIENYPSIKKITRATSREKKERDQKGDFEYLEGETMKKMIESGDVLFSYESHRSMEQNQFFGLLYTELLQLKDSPCITTR